MSQSNNLRQKAIGVLYLVVLCLYFLYYSLDFSDSIYLTHRRLDQNFLSISVDADAHIASLTARAMKNDSAVAVEKMNRAAPVEAGYVRTVRLIDSLQASLVGEGGLGSTGFPVKGKSHFPVQKLMINEHGADTLWQQLTGYYILLGRRDSTIVDSVLGHKGRRVAPASFYFDHMPMNMALTHLSALKLSLLREKIDFYNRLFEDTSKTERNVKILRNLREEAAARAEKANHDSALATAPKVTTDTTVGLVGRTVTISLPRRQNHPLTVRVSKSGQEIAKSSTTARQYSFTPSQSGVYRFTVTGPDGRQVRQVDLVAAEPVITHPQYSTLFTGIDNQLEIKDLVPGKDVGSLRYKVDGPGQVIVRDKKIYFRTDRKGRVTITVYDDGAGSVAPLCAQEFVVRELSAPTAYIRGTSGATDIMAADLHGRTALAARSEEQLMPEEVYVSDFDFVFIPSGGKPFSFYYHNSGASFNDKVLDALSQVRPGNILLFTNIHTKSSLGAERPAAPITINVK